MFCFDHVAVTAVDFEGTKKFYGALGFEELKSWTYEPRKMQACMLKNEGGQCIEIFHFEDYIPTADTVGSHFARDGEAIEEDLPQIGLKHLAFRVKDLRAVVEKLQSEGLCGEVDIMPGGHGNIYCFIRDPNGVFVEFMENPYFED